MNRKNNQPDNRVQLLCLIKNGFPSGPDPPLSYYQADLE